jgi:phenylacetate-CoA ligase
MIDYFSLPGGRLMHPYQIGMLLSDEAVSLIRQYQLVQESIDRITLRVVPAGTFPPETLSRIEQSVGALLGDDIHFQIELVPKCDLEPTGKFRFFRSMVRSDYDGIDWDGRQGA